MGVLDILNRAGGNHGLTGKVVAVYCREREAGGGVYEDVRVVQIGFNPFLVGRYVSPEPSQEGPWTGVENWIAISDISRLVVFDSVESARRTFATEGPTPMPTEA